MKTDPVSKMFCFLAFRILDNGQSPEPQWFWVLYTMVKILSIIAVLGSEVHWVHYHIYIITSPQAFILCQVLLPLTTGGTISNTNGLEGTKIWSWVLTGNQTQEWLYWWGKQQFGGLDCTVQESDGCKSYQTWNQYSLYWWGLAAI
jgi:hypothetical protein